MSRFIRSSQSWLIVNSSWIKQSSEKTSLRSLLNAWGKPALRLCPPLPLRSLPRQPYRAAKLTEITEVNGCPEGHGANITLLSKKGKTPVAADGGH